MNTCEEFEKFSAGSKGGVSLNGGRGYEVNLPASGKEPTWAKSHGAFDGFVHEDDELRANRSLVASRLV
jgi:hypothetical protein